MTIQEQAALMKLDSSKMAATTSEKRNSALKAIIAALLSNKEAILAANKKIWMKPEKVMWTCRF